jgi:DNA-binding response OmpR family regulator
MAQEFAQKAQKKPRKEIVIVERNDAFADLLQEMLWQKTSCKIFRVSMGEQALRIVPQLRPDLLIVGFQLADMTGLDIYERLHASKELSSLPTLLLNTRQFRVHNGPAPSFSIEQPFDVDVLLQTIAALLGEDIWVE